MVIFVPYTSRFLRRSIVLAMIVTTWCVASPALAARCPGVTVSGPVHDQRTVAVLSAQANAPVRVFAVYRASGWSVFGLDPGGGDYGYMFFHGAPKAAPAAFTWGGSAEKSEYGDVVQEIRARNAGVPTALVRCVAVIATTGERPQSTRS